MKNGRKDRHVVAGCLPLLVWSLRKLRSWRSARPAVYPEQLSLPDALATQSPPAAVNHDRTEPRLSSEGGTTPVGADMKMAFSAVAPVKMTYADRHPPPPIKMTVSFASFVSVLWCGCRFEVPWNGRVFGFVCCHHACRSCTETNVNDNTLTLQNEVDTAKTIHALLMIQHWHYSHCDAVKPRPKGCTCNH
jgi:hypothetical protein